MRSASSDPEQADLTAKAKIRNAAIVHFVRDGFQKANTRAVAAAAGVSVGLVFHHFGSKDGLRSACDEHVLQVLTTRAGAAGHAAGMQDLLGVYQSDPEEYRLLVQYMVRAIQEDAAAAGTFVDTLVAESEAVLRAGAADGTMRPSSDPRALAVLSVLISLSVLTMAPPLARALGHEDFGPDVLRRMTLPTLELFTHGLYTDDTLPETARDAWSAARPRRQEKD
jgi:AcrR family transcriptional regulator